MKAGCEGCGKDFEVTDGSAGEIVQCPACQELVTVPGESAVAGACPGCGARMGTRSVLCIECGYDIRTGKRPGGATQRAPQFGKRRPKAKAAAPSSGFGWKLRIGIFVVAVILVLGYSRFLGTGDPSERGVKVAREPDATRVYVVKGPEHLTQDLAKEIRKSALWRAYFSRLAASPDVKKPTVKFEIYVVGKRDDAVLLPFKHKFEGGSVAVILRIHDVEIDELVYEAERRESLPKEVEASSGRGAQEKAFQTAEITAFKQIVEGVEVAAAYAIVESDLPEAIVAELLVMAMAHKNRDVRGRGATGLHALGARAVPALVAALKGDDARLRMEAVGVLTVIGPQARDATLALAKVMGGESATLRHAAGEALEAIGPEAHAAVPTLKELRTWEGSGHRGSVMAAAQRQLLYIQWPDGDAPPEEQARKRVCEIIAGLQRGRPECAAELAAEGSVALTAFPALVDALQAGDNALLRRGAASALGRFGPDGRDAIAALTDALRDDEVRVRIAAAVALAGVGTDFRKPLTVLATAYAEGDEPVRGETASAIAAVASQMVDAVPALIDMLGGEGPDIRVAAALALGSVSGDRTEVVTALSAALQGEDVALQEAAATALGNIGPEAESAAPLLLERRTWEGSGRRAEVMLAAQSALVKMQWAGGGGEARPATAGRSPMQRGELAKLSEELAREDVFKLMVGLQKGQAESAVGLAKIGPAAEEAMPALVEALGPDKPAGLRKKSALALGRLGRVAAETAPVLSDMLQDDDHSVRLAAAVALTQIMAQPSDAVPVLTDALNDENAAVRAKAVRALTEIGPRVPRALWGLVRLLESGNRDAIAAAEALRRIGRPAGAAVPALRKVRTWQGSRHRGELMVAAQRALIAIICVDGSVPRGETSCLEVCRHIAGVQDGDVRAVRELRQKGTAAKGAVPVLIEVLTVGTDSLLRQEAARALAGIAPKDKRVVAALLKILDDPDEEVRRIAHGIRQSLPGSALWR